MQSKAATVDAYLKEVPEDRREALKKVRGLIRKTAPGVRETMQFGMPTYSREGVLLYALASQKGYMALYVCDTETVARHRPRLGKLNCGKSCIRFGKLEDLPLGVVSDILRDSLRRREAMGVAACGGGADSRTAAGSRRR